MSSPEFCVTWVAKVHAFRDVPLAVKADPPPMSTSILLAQTEKDLSDPYDLCQGLFGTDIVPDWGNRSWRDRR